MSLYVVFSVENTTYKDINYTSGKHVENILWCVNSYNILRFFAGNCFLGFWAWR